MNKLRNFSYESYVRTYISFVEYLLVQWEEEDGHSVVNGKHVELREGSTAFIPDANVVCHLREGDFVATIFAAGIN